MNESDKEVDDDKFTSKPSCEVSSLEEEFVGEIFDNNDLTEEKIESEEIKASEEFIQSGSNNANSKEIVKTNSNTEKTKPLRAVNIECTRGIQSTISSSSNRAGSNISEVATFELSNQSTDSNRVLIDNQSYKPITEDLNKILNYSIPDCDSRESRVSVDKGLFLSSTPSTSSLVDSEEMNANVKRCLWEVNKEEVDRSLESQLKRLNREERSIKRTKWNFDFEIEAPLVGRYKWRKEVDTPSFYKMTDYPPKKMPNKITSYEKKPTKSSTSIAIPNRRSPLKYSVQLESSPPPELANQELNLTRDSSNEKLSSEIDSSNSEVSAVNKESIPRTEDSVISTSCAVISTNSFTGAILSPINYLSSATENAPKVCVHNKVTITDTGSPIREEFGKADLDDYIMCSSPKSPTESVDLVSKSNISISEIQCTSMGKNEKEREIQDVNVVTSKVKFDSKNSALATGSQLSAATSSTSISSFPLLPHSSPKKRPFEDPEAKVCSPKKRKKLDENISFTKKKKSSSYQLKYFR